MTQSGTAQAEFDGLYIDAQTGLLRQFPRPQALTRDELKKFQKNQAAVQRGLLLIAKGNFEGLSLAPQPNLRFDKRREGWTLLEHAPRQIISVADLDEPVSFLQDGETSIRGYDLIGRARYEFDANLGQEDGEWLLDREAEIPIGFRQFYFPLTATIWRLPFERLYVPYLTWGGERWHLSWGWLEDGWDSNARLLRLHK